MEPPARGDKTRSHEDDQQLAKEWLLRMVERTPLADVEGLPVSWITSEAPRLIGDIFSALDDPTAGSDRALAGRKRAESLGALRRGADAAERVSRDLAALQGLMVEAIRRDAPDSQRGEFPATVARLAEIFGELQGAVSASMVEAVTIEAPFDQLTGLATAARMEDWIGLLLAENRRYGHPFALALVDIDGLEKINRAYGDSAGDRMLSAIAGVIRRQVRSCDQAFRFADDEFAVIAPHTDGAGLVPMVERIASLIAEAQLPEGPRLAITAGVSSCPADGRSPEHLIARAEQATYAAKAQGRPILVPINGGAPE